MKRSALLIARLIAVPALAIGLFGLDRWIGSALHPSLDAYDRGSYVPIVFGVLGSTVASAVVAGIAGSAAALLYGRWALLAALAIVLPILHDAWPWNPAYHDVRWSAWVWVISFYGFGIVLVFVLGSVSLARRSMRRSNKTMEPTR